MSISEKTGGKGKLHPRLLANEVYLANPNIVGVQNQNVNPRREAEQWYGSNTKPTRVVPTTALLRRRF